MAGAFIFYSYNIITNKTTRLVGASGAIYAVVGYSMVQGSYTEALTKLFCNEVVNLLFAGHSGIAYTAHIGGLLFGMYVANIESLK